MGGRELSVIILLRTLPLPIQVYLTDSCVIVVFFFFTCSRPRSVDEVAYQDEVVAVLRKSLQGADVGATVCMCTTYHKASFPFQKMVWE